MSERAEKIAALIRMLLSELAPADQRFVLDEIRDLLRPIPMYRAGEALSAIVNLLPQRHEWTVHDLRTEIAARGVVSSQKEIYNALGYLNRKGKVSRTGYGRYSYPSTLSLPPFAHEKDRSMQGGSSQ